MSNLLNELILQFIQLGDYAYEEIKNGNIKDSEMEKIADEIAALQKNYYDEIMQSIPDKEDKVCPDCGKPYKEGVKFCSSCGMNIEEFYSKNLKICDKCHSNIDADSNYCTICGYPVSRGEDNEQ